MKCSKTKLENTVFSLCSEVWARINRYKNDCWAEEQLWEELICCILSSQVSYVLAKAATQELINAGLINFNKLSVGSKLYEKRVNNVLKRPIRNNGKKVHYRFPNLKARQISEFRNYLIQINFRISDIIYNQATPAEIRNQLIKAVPGVGPKQASMFLRNIGRSYDLAILDRHVINYMVAVKMTKNDSIKSFGKKEYLTNEELLIQYASGIGYPVGCVDWAIWIVMRVARKEGYV